MIVFVCLIHTPTKKIPRIIVGKQLSLTKNKPTRKHCRRHGTGVKDREAPTSRVVFTFAPFNVNCQINKTEKLPFIKATVFYALSKTTGEMGTAA